MNLEKRHLTIRPRRLRRTQNLRQLVRETSLTKDDLISPIFVTAGENIKNEVSSMPGVFQYSIDRVNEEVDNLINLGISRIILFGIPEYKDETGSDAYNDNGIIQQAIMHLKKHYPDLYIITDVCMCEYTDHGHCGILQDGDIDNDSTLGYLQKQVISHAKAGADMVAPSGMMDGMIGAIREALDGQGYTQIPIMSYAIKYSSAFYGPFREAAESAPKSGNRKTYQMDPGNINEGLKEAWLDLDEGADILMVKPAMSYLDVISKLKDSVHTPIACYNVSGEYSMIKAAQAKDWIDGDQVMMESLLSMKRAGADIIITYFAKDAARLLDK